MITKTTGTFVDFGRGSLYIRRPRWELYATTDTGLPFLMFSKNRQGPELELWGFGRYLVISRKG